MRPSSRRVVSVKPPIPLRIPQPAPSWPKTSWHWPDSTFEMAIIRRGARGLVGSVCTWLLKSEGPQALGSRLRKPKVEAQFFAIIVWLAEWFSRASRPGRRQAGSSPRTQGPRSFRRRGRPLVGSTFRSKVKIFSTWGKSEYP